MTTTCTVRCWSNRYGGKWVVLRDDGKVMTESHDLFAVLRWLRSAEAD